MLLRLRNAHNVQSIYNAFSLIEILISMVLSTVILFAVATLYTQIYKKDDYILEKTNLQIQTHQILEYIKLHLQHSGYLGLDRNVSNYSDFLIHNKSFYITPNCILFFYDANKNGSINSLHKSDPQEVFGFKYSNQEIYFYKLKDQNVLDNTDYLKQKSLSCRVKDNWESITKDFRFKVNNLNFIKQADNIIQIELVLNSRQYPKLSYQITAYTYLLNGNK